MLFTIRRKVDRLLPGIRKVVLPSTMPRGLRFPPNVTRAFAEVGPVRWLRNFEQGAKWNLGLTAGMFCLRIRSEDEEASPPEPHTGLQGEGGPGCPEERSNDCAAC